MHNPLYNFEINIQVCINPLADLNIGHCVELTFFEGKLDGFLVVRVLNSSCELKQFTSEV